MTGHCANCKAPVWLEFDRGESGFHWVTTTRVYPRLVEIVPGSDPERVIEIGRGDRKELTACACGAELSSATVLSPAQVEWEEHAELLALLTGEPRKAVCLDVQRSAVMVNQKTRAAMAQDWEKRELRPPKAEPTKPKERPVILWNGRKFAADEDGELREITGPRGSQRAYLSQAVWRDAHGPIPQGMRVCQKDGDPQNCSVDNLELRPDPSFKRSGEVRKEAAEVNGSAQARTTKHIGGPSAPLRVTNDAAASSTPAPTSAIAGLYLEYAAGKSVIALARREGRDPRELLRDLQEFCKAGGARKEAA